MKEYKQLKLIAEEELLYDSNQIEDENGGSIRIESEKGKGAKFIFTWKKNL